MSDTATETKPAVASSRPTKPDEEAYKADLAKAEKELEQAKKRLVCGYPCVLKF
jgi:hypothetical protein